MTENFVKFSLNIPFSKPSTKTGKLVLEKDNPTGMPEYDDSLVIPVRFKEIKEEPKELMTVKIFLSDSRFVNEPYFDCGKTIAVERKVEKSSAVAQKSIEALLRGATQEEINQGFVSSINPGSRLNKITIENDVAKVDFDKQFQMGVGGSCRVLAIKEQINKTLLQFPNVKKVIISVDGETEGILEP